MIVIHSLRGGGAERVLINLLKGLDRSEFSINLVLYEGVFDYPLPDNIEVAILDIGASRNLFKLIRGFVLKIIRLALLFRRKRPDVIFSLLSSTNVAVIIAKVLSRTKSKLIVSEHTYPSVNLANEMYGGITRLFIKRCYPEADRIIAVSESIKQDLVLNFHFPETKIEVVYNPVDIGEIERLSKETVEHPWFHDKTPVIVSVGRLTKQKGYPYLLHAFSLAKKHLSCRLAIIGDGEDKAKLLGMAKGLGVEREVEFLGFQKNPFKYLARSSLFVLSSLYEGFPNVILEAMALGLPVISTDCPSGPAEIIEDRKSGLLVPVRDEQALAGAIMAVMTDERLRESLGREARQRAGTFALEKIAKDYRRVFSDNSPSPS
jgi:glycosyltransferase involved in cell wall biosynthesis